MNHAKPPRDSRERTWSMAVEERARDPVGVAPGVPALARGHDFDPPNALLCGDALSNALLIPVFVIESEERFAREVLRLVDRIQPVRPEGRRHPEAR